MILQASAQVYLFKENAAGVENQDNGAERLDMFYNSDHNNSLSFSLGEIAQEETPFNKNGSN